MYIFCGEYSNSEAKCGEVYENITNNSHPIPIRFNYCNYLYEKIHLPELEPIKLIKTNVDDLNIAKHKVNHY